MKRPRLLVRARPRQRPLKRDDLPPQSLDHSNRHPGPLALRLARERATSVVSTSLLVPGPRPPLPVAVRQVWVSGHAVRDPAAPVVAKRGKANAAMLRRVGALQPKSVLLDQVQRLGEVRRVGMPVEAPTIVLPVGVPTTQMRKDQARVGLYRCT